MLRAGQGYVKVAFSHPETPTQRLHCEADGGRGTGLLHGPVHDR